MKSRAKKADTVYEQLKEARTTYAYNRCLLAKVLMEAGRHCRR